MPAYVGGGMCGGTGAIDFELVIAMHSAMPEAAEFLEVLGQFGIQDGVAL